MKTTKQDRARMRAENHKWPRELVAVPQKDWLPAPWDRTSRIAVWRSKDWLVQIFQDTPQCLRMTVNRTDQDRDGQWIGGITWDELQDLKRKCGYGNCIAVEVYPPDHDVVNVANMRHLWIPVGESIDVLGLIPWWRKPFPLSK